MERSTRAIKLPISKYTAYVVQWYTAGERDDIDKVMLEGVVLSYDENKGTKVQGMKPDFLAKQQRKMVLLGVKRLVEKTKEGDKEIEINEESLLSLPDKDYDLILANLPELPLATAKKK